MVGGYGVMGVYGGIEPTWAAQTNVGRTHIATKGIVQSGLVLNLDAGVSSSYPGSGTTWTDLSGNGNNGTLVNGVGYSGDNGGSLVFDGVNDYVDCGNSSIRSATSLSLNFICYCTGFSNPSSNPGAFSWAPLISIDKFQNGNSWRKVAIYLNSMSGVQSMTFNFYDGVGGSRGASYSTTVLNTWINLTSTVDSNNSRLYLNGVLVYEMAGITLNSNPQNSEFTLGSRINSDYDGYFKGNISHVSIYNRALTPQEIAQNFNALKGRFGL